MGAAPCVLIFIQGFQGSPHELQSPVGPSPTPTASRDVEISEVRGPNGRPKQTTLGAKERKEILDQMIPP